ncbi:hypothetical protein DM860_009083 [Cuscuta australis]|uniref:Uncharacterized protein n=1 Tax=Cuscuta australis TaxID=267555 RepID=A0A328DC82_9ASTE|nr:hypothetical protein DM860_009083 [Cuscuta australis]
MGRRGFSGGGRGGGGGGRPACRSKASRDAEGNILIQRAAASNGFRSALDRIWYGPDNSHEDLCKSLLQNFEMCLDRHGKESKQCQFEAEELKKFCDIEV